ncbi:MAG TPA: diguanylate cyclase [Mycobacteriales bacterium]|jgi:diguanylate cyclase (GGDEF)-like protein/PAS domain S-box-containing protein|nr:diguanylate cyclase [Mycobacteriales bacterium]
MTTVHVHPAYVPARSPAVRPGAVVEPLVDLSTGAVLAQLALTRLQPDDALVPPQPSTELTLDLDAVPVLEIGAAALAERPAAVLDRVDEARRDGWVIALSGLATSPASVALMPFLRPDVLSVDLRPAQQQRGQGPLVEVVNAVTAQAAESGAFVVAEHLETPEQAQLAQSMGVGMGLGQVPAGGSGAPVVPYARIVLPGLTRPEGVGSPWQQRPEGSDVRLATKRFLVTVSRWLEGQAALAGAPAVVLTSVGRARWFTTATAGRYAALARTAALVGVLGRDVAARPAPGVRGAGVPPGDPLADEWVVAVVGPHFAGALLAHDLGDPGLERDRRYEYVVTYDREQVLRAAEHLLRRLPAAPAGLSGALAPVGVKGASGRQLPGTDPGQLLTSALSSSSNGLCICDARLPDLPMVYVNPAMERLTGYDADHLLGRNPRFLQGGVADPDAVAGISRQLRLGREARVTLRNRRPDGTPWWNEMHLLPVRDRSGTITNWVGTANDVTARVEAERQVTHLALHDPLTGLANRRQLAGHLRSEIGRADRHGGTVALLFLDLDGFKAVNDRHGHGAGDLLLVAVAERLRGHVRVGDLLGRQGGDEFLLVLSGLPPAKVDAVRAAREVADKLRAELRRPFELAGRPLELSTSTSIGISLSPHDAADAAAMLDHADSALYQVKARGNDDTAVYDSDGER